MRILLFAYNCIPGAGSESGIGWNWASRLPEDAEVYVLAHPQNRAAVLRYLESRPIARLHFEWVSLPGLLDPWEGPRPLLLIRVRYTLWQLAAYLHARRLLRRMPFDVVHHVSWGTMTGLTLGWALGPPFIWGPIGGGHLGPIRMFRYLGTPWLGEWLRNLRIRLARITPWVVLAARRAKLVLVANQETYERIRALGVTRVQLMPDVAVDPDFAPDEVPIRHVGGTPIVAWVGGLEPHKAPTLAIEAFAQATRVQPGTLWMMGSGSMGPSCLRLAQRLGVADQVKLWGQVPHEKIADYLACADLFLWTSLRDTFLPAVLEAMAWGLPVVALDHQGIRMMPNDALVKIPLGSPESVLSALSEAVVDLIQSPERRTEIGRMAHQYVKENHLWPIRVAAMRDVYASI